MKTGRNEPCPCGSGKKYKKCCLERDRSEEMEESLADLAPVVGWLLGEEGLNSYFMHLTEEYFPKGDEAEGINFEMLLDAFIFDYKIPGYDKTPLEIYLEKAELFPSKRRDYEKLLGNVFSAFEILDVELNEGMKLKDIINDKVYSIKEKKGTHGTAVGNLIICRIGEVGNSFRIIGPGIYSWPSETAYSLKRIVNKLKLKGKDRSINSFSILDIILKKKDKDRPLRPLDELKDALKKKLREMGVKINDKEIDKRINGSTNFKAAFPEIFEHNFESGEDFKETISLIKDLWNSYPRKEFGGQSPNERMDYGPKEMMLVQSLISEGTSRIDPDKYPSPKDAENAFMSFQEKWLHKPQKELNGKTPMEVILQERKEAGNPRKDVSLSVHLSRVYTR